MRILLLWLCSMICAQSFADTDPVMGVYMGAGTFKYDTTGEFSAGGEPVDVGVDLDLGDEQKGFFYLDLDHRLPLLPKLRLETMSVQMNGTSELIRDITIDGTSFIPPSGLRSTFTWDQISAAFYYRIFDGPAQLDLGLSVRQIEGEITVDSSISSVALDFDETVPMLYSKFRFQLMNGWWFGAEFHGTSISSNELIDMNTKLGWVSDWGIGGEFGYRLMQLELEDAGDLTGSDLSIEGPYFGLNFQF
ncbi:MAG: TIGR04219 family outer membrane beta-barrel protein [Pseudomonadota bacterium]